QERFDEQTQILAPPTPQESGEREIEQRRRHRAPGHPELVLTDQRLLQSSRDERCAEYDRSVDIVLDFNRTLERVEHRDADVEQEEQDEKRLRRVEIRLAIARNAPQRADDERAREAKQVQ